MTEKGRQNRCVKLIGQYSEKFGNLRNSEAVSRINELSKKYVISNNFNDFLNLEHEVARAYSFQPQIN